MARSKHLRFWVSLWPHLIALPITAGAALGFYFSPNPIPLARAPGARLAGPPPLARCLDPLGSEPI